MTFQWNPPRHIDGNYCISPDDMRRLEAREIEEIPNRGRELMEIAGREAALAVINRYPDAQEILIFCGTGNNGGDGFAAAWYLMRCGISVILFVFDPQCAKTPDARYMFERVKSLTRYYIRDANDAGCILEWKRRRNIVVIDAIFGIGYKPRHDVRFNRVYQCIGDLECPVVSIDMPSGVDAQTGYCGAIDDERPPRAVYADLTVTFGAPKYGQFFGAGPAHCGIIQCADIGLRPYPDGKPRCAILSDDWCRRQFEPDTERRMDLHKGDCGHVVVIGGAPSMTGAACLSGRAALRAGCGLVTLATRAPAAACDEIMHCAICGDDGVFLPDKLAACLKKADCLLIGPGLGRDETALEIVRACANCPARIVLDADALWAISEQKISFSAAELYITPHPAEAARLLAAQTSEILFRPIESAEKLAAQYAATTVLKSHVSLIASRPARISPSRFALNPYPNPAIATAGSGDVFAGILAGIVAQARSGAFRRWFDAFEIASYAVHIHSRAGRRAALKFGNAAVAGDIIDQL